MTQTHTPAPWDVRAQWDGHGVDYYLINPEQDEKPMDEIYANGNLISAAPELLEALELCISRGVPVDIYDAVSAARNKAKGNV